MVLAGPHARPSPGAVLHEVALRRPPLVLMIGVWGVFQAAKPQLPPAGSRPLVQPPSCAACPPMPPMLGAVSLLSPRSHLTSMQQSGAHVMPRLLQVEEGGGSRRHRRSLPLPLAAATASALHLPGQVFQHTSNCFVSGVPMVDVNWQRACSAVSRYRKAPAARGPKAAGARKGLSRPAAAPGSGVPLPNAVINSRRSSQPLNMERHKACPLIPQPPPPQKPGQPPKSGTVIGLRLSRA